MLNLTSIELAPESSDGGRGLTNIHYLVRHNVGSLRTVVSNKLTLTLNPQGAVVDGQLVLDGVKAPSVEASRELLAVQCDRMAAALRSVVRCPDNPDLPRYDRAVFNPDNMPHWLQAVYASLVVKLTLSEDRAEVLREAVEDKNPLMYIPGALDNAQADAEAMVGTE